MRSSDKPVENQHTTAPAGVTGGTLSALGDLVVRWLSPVDGSVIKPSPRKVVLGRAEECDFCLEGTESSRRHAELVRDGPLLIVRDLGSRNGTFVNGVRIQEAPLAPGDVLRAGEWIGIVSAATESIETAFQRVAEDLCGGAELIQALEPAQRGARSNLPVILEGETGTGKERVARAIHGWSGRSGPFAAVNCAALPEALAEGELFGYRRGAFTGADRNHSGHFQFADCGTLLLDEICDLPPMVQAKLLRVLEEREVLPLGETRPVAVDVRVIAAAQEPLREAVAAKRFRADLFARLQGIAVKLPPLKVRIGDVPSLFRHLLAKSSTGPVPALESRLIEQLCLYDWPFNVRELELLARRLLTLHGHDGILRRSHLPEEIRQARGRENATSAMLDPNVDRAEYELRLLISGLREHGGNVARAAASVGISRQRAYRLMNGRADVDLKALREDRGS